MEGSKKEKYPDLLSVSARLVDLIESHAHELAWRWLQDVLRRQDMPTYGSYDQKELYNRAYAVYSQLGKWISRETSEEEIAKIYAALGRQRRQEGFALSEVIQALIITRRQIWLKIQANGYLDTALDLSQALELYNHVLRFFDRAIYYAAVGYVGKDLKDKG